MKKKSAVEDSLESVFSELGQRSTTPRRLLIGEISRLADSGEGFTAESLWHRLRESSPSIGRATVFRTVRQLVEKDILDSIDVSDGNRLYRACGRRILPDDHHHHHLVCVQCHKIVDLHICLDNAVFEDLARQENFQIASHSITLYGLCADCREQSRSAAP